MTISIWIIITLIITIFALFYYKKNKFKLSKPKNEIKKKDEKYKLFDVDKMLDNVTSKEIEQENILKEEQQTLKKEELTIEENDSSPKKKTNINFKDGIITSILLKKKD